MFGHMIITLVYTIIIIIDLKNSLVARLQGEERGGGKGKEIREMEKEEWDCGSTGDASDAHAVVHQQSCSGAAPCPHVIASN